MVENARQLKYPDNRVLYLVQELSDRFDDLVELAPLPFTDMTTRQLICFMLNNKEYTQLLSAVSTGADLAYPDLSHELQLIFMNPVEGGAMSCEDVADCIDTSEDVLNALLNQLIENGYAPNPESANSPLLPVINATSQAGNLIEDITDCSIPEKDMSIARAIVRELHESTLDAFELFELQTNVAEATGITLGFIPAAGTGKNLVDFVNWVLETLVETYQAAYTQSAEDEIACAIFCHMQDECSLSYDDLLTIYEDIGSLTIPSLDNIEQVLQFAIDTAITVDTTGVAIWHYHMLQMIRFGETFGVSFNNIKQAMIAASTMRDYTYEDLCDCTSETPTDYWMIYQDFRVGMGDWTIFRGTITADGVQSATNGTRNDAQVRINDLGADFGIVACGVDTQARGHIGNGTNDFITGRVYENANISGTERVVSSVSAIVSNTNDVVWEQVQVTPQSGESMMVSCAGSGTLLYPTRFVTIKRVVWYGNCNVGQVKPPMAVYVSSIPTVGNLFPS